VQRKEGGGRQRAEFSVFLLEFLLKGGFPGDERIRPTSLRWASVECCFVWVRLLQVVGFGWRGVRVGRWLFWGMLLQGNFLCPCRGELLNGLF